MRTWYISAISPRRPAFRKAQRRAEVELSRYAETLVEVSRVIKESAYDVVPCPMRGARMPGLQGNVVCQSEPFEPFEGTDMAQKFNDQRILSDLRRLIHKRPDARKSRNIGVLDTAVGGDSCGELARLLRRLNEEGKERWSVRFHLIDAEGRQPRRARGV
jgi:hypothetical protein